MALTSLYPISSPEPSDLMAARVSLPLVRNTSRFGRKPGVQDCQAASDLLYVI